MSDQDMINALQTKALHNMWRDDTLPVAIPANDRRVLVRGEPLPVPFRIVSEETWQSLMATVSVQDELLARAHDAIRSFEPVGTSNDEGERLCREILAGLQGSQMDQDHG